jgi:putative phage-type endonuclease
MESEIQQGTDAWHEFRAQGIGGSEVGTILGLNPYQTPMQLWRVRTHRDPSDISNYAMERGQRLEPKARAFVEISVGLDFPARLAVWSGNPIFRASLDGYNEEKKAILEIKCPGEKNHQMNLRGEIQPYYRAQMEHQLLCSGAELVYFVSYYEPQDGGAASVKILEYRSDPELRERILKEVPQFWSYIVNDVPPPLTDKDTLILESSEAFNTLVKIYDAIQVAEEQYAALKEDILNSLTHTKVKCGRVSISNKRVTIRDPKETT